MREFGNLGKFLKNARSDRALTQKDVAEKLGLHVQFVSNWERGICAPPGHSFQKMIQLLRLDRSELVDVMLTDSKSYIQSKVYKKKPKATGS
jgi:transcriptional regulator with XRE-family HTH domain